MFTGVLTKMQTEYATPISYFLVFKQDFMHMNQYMDKKITISFEKYECLHCQKNEPIYRQGFCKSCFFEVPQAADWIIKPELSKAHLGIEDRDLDYEQKVQLQPHVVYLALSSAVKVGVTRKTQIPTRWIDQGADKAIAIVELPNRYLAGITEVALKDHFTDKTNWRKMLTNSYTDTDLLAVKKEIAALLPKQVLPYFLEQHQEVCSLEFPVEQYPEKVKSLNLTKTPSYTGVLKGIKGQYLIFEDNTVFNIRSNEGLVVTIQEVL